MSKKKWNTPKVDKSTTLEVKEDTVVSDTTLEVKEDIPRIKFSKETLQELLKDVKENDNLTFQGLYIYYLEDMISKLQ